MFGIDFSTVGVFLAVVTGFGSFLLGRYLSRRYREKRRERERAADRALESRQVRRARERQEKG